MISRGLKQKKQKYCKEESLRNWQLKSKANVKGLGGSSSVSASLATKLEKSDLGGIEIREKITYNEILFQTVLNLFLTIIWYVTAPWLSFLTPSEQYLVIFKIQTEVYISNQIMVTNHKAYF